jgi:hypothetical protein
MFPFAVVKPTRETATITASTNGSVTATGSAVLALFVAPQSQVWEVVEILAEGAVADRVKLQSKTDSADGSPVAIEYLSHGANGTVKDVVTTPQRIQITGSSDATANNRARLELVNTVAASGTASGVIVLKRVS